MLDDSPPPASWDELPRVIPAGRAYAAPPRVSDGLVASILTRPIWSLAVQRLEEARWLKDVMEIAGRANKRCVSVRVDAVWEKRGVEILEAETLADLGNSLSVAPASIAHIGVDEMTDGVAALESGIKPILIGRPVTLRGAVAVRDCDELEALLRGGLRIRTTSTYHEI